MANPLQEISKLRQEIARHDALYYRQAEPEIDDQAYDHLKAQLQKLEAQHPELPLDDSPTQNVGDDRLEAFESYTHRQPMLSLDNTYNQAELIAFGDRLEKRFPDIQLDYLIEPKIDGVAVSLTYEQGKFIRAVSRGNGTEGDDITQNVRHIQGLPQQIQNAPEVIEIRGEIYMRHDEFERINQLRTQAEQPLYANPRNLAAGTIKLLDPAEARTRQLDIVLYGIGACEPQNFFSQQSEIQEKLKDWNLPVLEKYWTTQGIEDAWASIEELDTIRNHFAYPTDGAVVKLNDFQRQQAAGYTSKAPRWAIAYKFEAEQAETRLNAITFQIGRTGAVTPVAQLEPVQLAGTMVARATLHNEDEIRRKDLRPGDTVLVQKAGEIIPQVLRVNTSKRPADSQAFDFAAELVKAGIHAERDPAEAVWRVTAHDDPQLQQRALLHFAGRPCMDIENLGAAVVEQLVSKRIATTPADLYSIKKEQLLELEKFAEKSADNLLNALTESKQRDLWQLIHGLGIPHVGKQSAKDLEQAFDSLDAIASASTDDLAAIDGIGNIMAESIHSWFQNTEKQLLIEQLKAAGLNFKSRRSPTPAGDLPLTGKTIVLTGTLPTLTRSQATEKIEAAGGRTSSSVSKKTDYLLTGESAGSKYNKAIKLGIPVLDEAAFLKLIQSD